MCTAQALFSPWTTLRTTPGNIYVKPPNLFHLQTSSVHSILLSKIRALAMQQIVDLRTEMIMPICR